MRYWNPPQLCSVIHKFLKEVPSQMIFQNKLIEKPTKNLIKNQGKGKKKRFKRPRDK